jgi:hypothetical protein
MCSESAIKFVQSCLTEEDVRGKQVLEAGSLDVNGSLRSFVIGLYPLDYTGIDLVEGPGVDEICLRALTSSSPQRCSSMSETGGASYPHSKTPFVPTELC